MRAFIITLLILCCQLSLASAQERLLLVPLDDRPVCYGYVVDSLQKAGVEVLTPPRELLPNALHDGDVVGLFAWLEENASKADAAVVATDTLLYGGLIGSRTHHISTKELDSRLDMFLRIMERSQIKTYAYSTIMRTPYGTSGRLEPPYYQQYGMQLHIWSKFWDMAEMRVLSKEECVNFLQWHWSVPATYRRDWQERREKNLHINKRLLQITKQGKFAYFILGNDDMSLLSASHREDRILRKLAIDLPGDRYGHFAGADQLGILLALRAHYDKSGKYPQVAVQYNTGVGAATVPAYEHTYIADTVHAHIAALGGVLTDVKNADLLLAVHTPINGETLDANDAENSVRVDLNAGGAFAELVAEYLPDKPVAVADIAFSNGSDNALVHALMSKNLAWQLAGYAGWNTAGNSVGYALAQGLLAREMHAQHRKELLAVRYADDWAYQANVRPRLREQVLIPRGWNEQNLGANLYYVQALAQSGVLNFMFEYSGAWSDFAVVLPWGRLFEAEIIPR